MTCTNWDNQWRIGYSTFIQFQWVKCLIEQEIAHHINCHFKLTIGIEMRNSTGGGSKCVCVCVTFQNFCKSLNFLFSEAKSFNIFHCNAKVGGWEFPHDSFYFLCIFLLDNITVFLHDRLPCHHAHLCVI